MLKDKKAFEKVEEALKEKGIQEGQTVRIRDMVFEFKEY